MSLWAYFHIIINCKKTILTCLKSVTKKRFVITSIMIYDSMTSIEGNIGAHPAKLRIKAGTH